MESSQNKLEYHKILIDNKRATKGQEFHWVLLYCGGDESGKPWEVNPYLKDFNLAEKTLLDYHLTTLFNNKLYDVWIVTYKEMAKSIMKHPVSAEMTARFNIKLYVLKEMEDSTVNAMRLISSDLTKDLIVIHGQYILDYNIKQAIAAHKIQSSDFTLVLKKKDELIEKVKKGSALNQFNIYGLEKKPKQGKKELKILQNAFGVYSMFNSFEAADPSGMWMKKSVLQKMPLAGLTLRSDLCDTGIYIMRNLFKGKLMDIQTIDFDLVRFMVNNQFKQKLLSFIDKQVEDEDTKEIDDLLDKEINQETKVVIIAWLSESPEDISIDCNVLSNQADKDGMDSEDDAAGQGDSMEIDSD